MLATSLMRSVVDEFRPGGLPSDEALESMTLAQLTELAAQQTRIIAAFRHQAGLTIAGLRSRMDALQAVVTPESCADESARPPPAMPGRRLAPGILGLPPRNPLVRPKPAALFPRRPPFRR
jgi:hypothetical protein